MSNITVWTKQHENVLKELDVERHILVSTNDTL